MAGKMDKKQKIGEGLYGMALVLWMLVALIKYTYYKDLLQVAAWDQYVFYVVLVLLFVQLVLNFSFRLREVIGLGVVVLFMTIAYAGGKLQFAVMFALIFAARSSSLHTVLRTALACQLFVFLLTVLGCGIGILEDVIWDEATRGRHALGFTHCMLASHFGLFAGMIYIAIRRRMTVIAAGIILLANGILFYLTDGRTDMYLSVLFVILAFVFGNLGERLKGERIIAVLAAAVPFLSLAVSIAICKMYTFGDAKWDKLNLILNNRLLLGHRGIATYGFTLFGQKIKWIGASSLYYDPSAIYNYVDNSYLMMMLDYGTVFILCYCIAMSYLLYVLLRQKETMLAVCILVTLAFGLINPQSMYLTYNPFLVLLSMVFYSGKRKMPGEGTGCEPPKRMIEKNQRRKSASV